MTDHRVGDRIPGLLLCVAIGVTGWLLQLLELRVFGRAHVEALVLALLVGILVAAVVDLPSRLSPGIEFSSRTLLEIAVCLIGVAIDTALLREVGLPLIAGIVGVVAVSLGATYGIARAFGLRPRLALLIAAGNSICGNSAIAAVAPVIGAEPEDVASAISFTAVLGVATVLLLPLLGAAMEMSDARYGVVAGLTVYAVPQVLAATLPVSAAAGAIATLVKLVRVLLLGPLVVAIGLASHRKSGTARGALVPWFIIGFIGFAALRSSGVLAAEAIDAIRLVATWLTIVAMAGLGLGVDVRVLGRSSGRIVAAVCLSLALLCVMSILLARSVAP